jgi:hypothetical protein
MKIILISILLNITLHSFGQKTYEANSLTCIKYFLSGDIKLSKKYISKAIMVDSTNLDYFYLRATINLYLDDTLSAISDFTKAVHLKKHFKSISKDSLTHSFVKQRPKHCNNLIESNYQLNNEFAQIQLGIWFYLYDKNKNASCSTLKNVKFERIYNQQILTDYICK